MAVVVKVLCGAINGTVTTHFVRVPSTYHDFFTDMQLQSEGSCVISSEWATATWSLLRELAAHTSHATQVSFTHERSQPKVGVTCPCEAAVAGARVLIDSAGNAAAYLTAPDTDWRMDLKALWVWVQSNSVTPQTEVSSSFLVLCAPTKPETTHSFYPVMPPLSLSVPLPDKPKSLARPVSPVSHVSAIFPTMFASTSRRE